MGAWDELDTEISAEVDFSDLDKLLDLDDEYGIFEPVKDIVEELKTNTDDGVKRGVYELSRRNKSFQEKWIGKNCDNPSGILASSVGYTEQDDYTIIVGTVLSHIYPMSIEYGHKDIYPIRAKALAFYATEGEHEGELIFRKHVRATKPRPFVAPAYDDTEEITEKIVVYEIAHAGVDWDN